MGFSGFYCAAGAFRSLPGLSVCRCRGSSQRGLWASALNEALLTPVKNNDPAVSGFVLLAVAQRNITESSAGRSAEPGGCRCVVAAA